MTLQQGLGEEYWLSLELSFKSLNCSVLAGMGLLEQCRVSPITLGCISAFMMCLLPDFGVYSHPLSPQLE